MIPIVKLRPNGTSRVITIPKAIIDTLKLEVNDTFLASIENDSIVFRKVEMSDIVKRMKE